MAAQPLAHHQVRSADGTRIACTVTGVGPPLVLVDGELGSRSFGPMPVVAAALAADFTVHTYDRRGRGESGDATPRRTTCHPDRETEDLAAVVVAAGGDVALYGASSGAVLVLRSLARLPGVRGAVVWEPPVVVKGPGLRRDYAQRLGDAVDRGQPDEALALFLTEVAGLPEQVVGALAAMPAWPLMLAAAPSLRHDAAVMGASTHGCLDGDLVAALGQVRVPVVVADGGLSTLLFAHGADAIARHLPTATRATLAGQTHDVLPTATAGFLVCHLRRLAHPVAA